MVGFVDFDALVEGEVVREGGGDGEGYGLDEFFRDEGRIGVVEKQFEPLVMRALENADGEGVDEFVGEDDGVAVAVVEA